MVKRQQKTLLRTNSAMKSQFQRYMFSIGHLTFWLSCWCVHKGILLSWKHKPVNIHFLKLIASNVFHRDICATIHFIRVGEVQVGNWYLLSCRCQGGRSNREKVGIFKCKLHVNRKYVLLRQLVSSQARHLL